MHGSIHMTGNRDEKEDLNNEDTEINRGVELVLRNKKGGKRKPKTFEVNFCIFKREITLSLDIIKQPTT